MISIARRLGATVLLGTALAVGGAATAGTASAAETQKFSGFEYSPSGEAALTAARYYARQQAIAAGYDADTQCTETRVRFSPPSPTFPYYSASSELTCTR